MTELQLFEADEYHTIWREWWGMPEYTHEDLLPWLTMYVHFRNRSDFEAFGELIEQKLYASRGAGGGIRGIWFPAAPEYSNVDKRYLG